MTKKQKKRVVIINMIEEFADDDSGDFSMHVLTDKTDEEIRAILENLGSASDIQESQDFASGKFGADNYGIGDYVASKIGEKIEDYPEFDCKF